MQIIIRKGEEGDVEAAFQLIRELALFEKAPDEVQTNVEQMRADGFGKKPAYRLLIAEADGEIVGTAIYFIKYSTWKGKGLYLDDIVVAEAFRGKTIGSKLFEAVLQDAKNENCKQMHWQVLDWNEPAIAFYKKYNAVFESGWINCKLHF
jgi:GNAT superfamily N-acetyltransferase